MNRRTKIIAALLLALALLAQAACAETDAGFEAPAPAEAPSAQALTEGYFSVIAGLESGTAGASLKTAVAAADVCAFAEANALYNPDVEPLRANMLAAFEAMDEEGQAAFWTNFDAVRALLDDCLENYEGNRGVFEDAGVAEAMDEAMYDPLNRLAWENLRDHTLALGDSSDSVEAQFSQWNADAPALNALIEYVEAVTDEASPDYIPPTDRVATFDMDGTLCAELNPTYLEYYLLARRILADPTYAPDEEMLEFGRMLRDCALDKSFPEGMDMLHATHAARAYAGMTLNEFADFVTRQIVREADGFEGMTYTETFYLPMIEVVEYLQDNDFKVFICSGSDRFICRTFIEGMLDIPYENIIGMDVELEATNQGDTDGLNYVYTANDTLFRTDRLLIKNLKTNKVRQIAQEIGRQPVLSFGNSSGDVSMHNYTLYNNAYRSMAFQLIADDEARDYGSAAKGPELRQKWEDMGFTVISMADDWKTIYGEDVVKTGEFHWLEDLAENIVPARNAEEDAALQGDDVQYVIYLGTNDKDNNTPVFTETEAMEKARQILIDRFGGYTIQEAHGGWLDGGVECQEYTLVIYLSDTTLDEVHAAADELVETFNQTAVLIQANQTATEFYGGAN